MDYSKYPSSHEYGIFQYLLWSWASRKPSNHYNIDAKEFRVADSTLGEN